MSTSDTDSEDGGINMFADPPDFYPPSPKPTTETHKLLNGQTLTLRLVGHNPLWGHHLWNAGRIVSTYLETNLDLVKGKTVLELGAGAGLPSLVCGVMGAKRVLVTDYPDPDLVENLWWNIEHCEGKETKKGENLSAAGYCWGADHEPLLKEISSSSNTSDHKYDVLILADLLFNHSEHAKLVSTVQSTLSKDEGAKALVFFTPYRPWLLEKDLAFFDLIKEGGFDVEKILEEKMEKVMFEEDRGDEELRRTVFGYVVTWKKNDTET